MVAFIVVTVLLAALIGGVTYFLWKRAHPAYAGPPQADVARAIQIVWVQTYKQAMAKLPTIQWMTGSELNAENGTCWVDAWGRTVAGDTDDQGRVSQVAWVKGELLSDCALAHELCHFFLFLTTGDPDANHTGPAFAPGGIKDQANAALRAVGL